MEPDAVTIEDRLARLEGQYHALAKELADNFKSMHSTLSDVRTKLEDVHTVKRGMMKKESLAETVGHIDDRLQEITKQIEALAKQLAGQR